MCARKDFDIGVGLSVGSGSMCYSEPMPDPVPDLEDLRQRLDVVDRELVELIARRLGIVASVAEFKAGTGTPVRDVPRERAVIESVALTARRLGVSEDLVRRIFREIIGHAVDRQAAELIPTSTQLVTVAFQGVEHAYGHLAAQKHIAGRGEDAKYLGYETYGEVVAALEAGRCDLAVVPIEDTTAGSINQVYDLLQHSDVAVVGEETWRVDHCLAGIAHVPLDAITHVLAHPHGFEQCATFLRSIPRAVTVHAFDPAEAMRQVAERGDASYAAIGSPESADAHGLTVLRRGIGDGEDNYTRFLVLAAKPITVDTRVPAKTSLVLSTRHEEGALLRCLEILAGSGHSMTKLESRPRPGRPFEYLFFLDFEGNVSRPADPARRRRAAQRRAVREGARQLSGQGHPQRAAARPGAPGGRGRRDRVGGRAGGRAGCRRCQALQAARRPGLPRRGHPRARRRPAGRRRRLRGDGRALLGRVGRAGQRHRPRGPRRGRARPARRRVQAAHVAVRVPGARLGGARPCWPRPAGAIGLPIVTEVMAVEQVAGMARVADILQVGARNMQNFDLLRALGKVDRPVLLKRGLSSTIDEWLAAAEYVLSAGNQQVILCERGIRTFESATRNTLDLSAVPVLRERTHLPVIVDPSHGTGKRRYVAPMSRAALAVGAHGLLIEVHPDPDTALSDADQSLDLAAVRGPHGEPRHRAVTTVGGRAPSGRSTGPAPRLPANGRTLDTKRRLRCLTSMNAAPEHGCTS